MPASHGSDTPLLCPSAQPNMDGARVLGVISGTVESPRLLYLDRPVPFTANLPPLPDSLKPTEVYRLTAPCAEHLCQHFDGSNCQLAKRIVQILPAVVDALPPCRIRPACRWWQEEGKAACLRCPQVVTDIFNPNDRLIQVAGPQPAPSQIPG